MWILSTQLKVGNEGGNQKLMCFFGGWLRIKTHSHHKFPCFAGRVRPLFNGLRVPKSALDVYPA